MYRKVIWNEKDIVKLTQTQGLISVSSRRLLPSEIPVIRPTGSLERDSRLTNHW